MVREKEEKTEEPPDTFFGQDVEEIRRIKHGKDKGEKIKFDQGDIDENTNYNISYALFVSTAIHPSYGRRRRRRRKREAAGHDLEHEEEEGTAAKRKRRRN